MAWTNTLTNMVRVLVGDMDTTDQKFTDTRIQQTVAVAAIYVDQEFDLSTSYTIDVDGPSISPDPTSKSDNVAMALFSLKAACILDTNRYQDATGNAVRVQEGDSVVDTSIGFRGYSGSLKNGPCATYAKLLKEKSFDTSSALGKA